MKKYLNKSGKSGVRFYETGKDYIKILFVKESKSYLYNYVKPGKTHVEKMKKLAEEGLGLSTYISQHVKENYFS
jgi:hypothetical protein